MRKVPALPLNTSELCSRTSSIVHSPGVFTKISLVVFLITPRFWFCATTIVASHHIALSTKHPSRLVLMSCLRSCSVLWISLAAVPYRRPFAGQENSKAQVVLPDRGAGINNRHEKPRYLTTGFASPPTQSVSFLSKHSTGGGQDKSAFASQVTLRVLIPVSFVFRFT